MARPVPNPRLERGAGDKVGMYLPTIGVNNGANAVPWVLMEVEEEVNRGIAQRRGTFVEHNDAAYYRVT